MQSFFESARSAAKILAQTTPEILHSASHPLHVQQQIAGIQSQRLKLVATIWCFLSVAWLPVDLLILPTSLWPEFTAIRVISIVGFGLLSTRPLTHEWAPARRGLMYFFAIQAFCALPAISLPVPPDGQWLATAFRSAYDDLPFVLIAAIGLFPIFLVDAVFAAACIFLAALAIGALQHWRGFETFDPATYWLLGLVGLIAVLSSVAQMEAILRQVERAARDALTGALPRRVGEEVLQAEIGLTLRHKGQLCLLFIDLDRFKLVNDEFGHEAGDALLRSVADHLQQALRRQDALIRWGGEEFIIVLPMTDLESSLQFLTRLAARGIGERPDGSRQTVSVGVAELSEIDATRDTMSLELVALADRRMYRAKEAGRNRVVTKDKIFPFLASQASV